MGLETAFFEEGNEGAPGRKTSCVEPSCMPRGNNDRRLLATRFGVQPGSFGEVADLLGRNLRAMLAGFSFHHAWIEDVACVARILIRRGCGLWSWRTSSTSPRELCFSTHPTLWLASSSPTVSRRPSSTTHSLWPPAQLDLAVGDSSNAVLIQPPSHPSSNATPASSIHSPT